MKEKFQSVGLEGFEDQDRVISEIMACVLVIIPFTLLFIRALTS